MRKAERGSKKEGCNKGGGKQIQDRGRRRKEVGGRIGRGGGVV